jgi:peptidyl-prolyl cis-trans isomerase A (cyclophilin A)
VLNPLSLQAFNFNNPISNKPIVKNTMKLPKIYALVALLSLFFVACQSKTAEPEEETYKETVAKVDTVDGLFAMIFTNKGNMICRLAEDKAPMAVANFIALSEGNMPNTFRKLGEPFYDSMKFHRVISFTNGDKENFMVQGGDPLGTGMGGPGYQFKDEFSDYIMDRPGRLAMANSGPGTNGSQFFITLKPTPWLNGVHTVFGEVIHGTEVPFMIKTNDTIIKIKILRKGAKALAYNAMDVFNSQKK